MSHFVKYFNQPIINFEIDWYSHSKDEGDWTGAEHMHNVTEVLYVLSGSGMVYSGKKKRSISKGDLIIINPHTMHAESSLKGDSLEYISFALKNMAFLPAKAAKKNKDSLPELLKVSKLNECYIIDMGERGQYVEKIIKRIEREINFSKQQSLNDLLCCSYLNQLVVFLLRSLPLMNTVYTHQSKDISFISSVKMYIDCHYSGEIMLDSLAGHFFVSKYYLAHTFKKVYGVTIIEYLKKVRCEVARDLLQTTNFSIANIATSVGFSSLSYFSKVYKTHYGESPVQTRQMTALKAESKNDE